ncbi:ankyrin repeat domain-containing protein [Shewanella algae]|uniref:ankyrin repeat domain-containing protein n=1 Tax=Shewanella algae TaxID=38313 RepID=UPI001AAD3DCA|nr:ankyrin repeat domain-containing protein [Shewanella algae]MBO2578412.1 ankyrin repeat domain-containing protein [Shewanella algae]MBO2645912.1 ankyrin repeat domain-containing protein [Shewanella algae]MBO2683899.1 ankyrin repeat domain-containing protein [Shewanella algae]
MNEAVILKLRTLMACIREKRTADAIDFLSMNTELVPLQTPLGSFLHIAADNDNLELCQALVKLGADIDSRDNISGSSPIHRAASNGNEDILNYFIGLGARLDISEPDRNPLFTAIHYGHFHIVKRLVEAGIDTSIRYTGQTMKDMGALEFAHEWGRTEIADYIKLIS